MSFIVIQVIDDVKVCRVCLAIDVKMHNLDTDPLKTAFEFILEKSVMSTIQLPMFLCFECAGFVRKFSLFKKRCLRGQSILLGFLQNGVQLSQQVIKNIDRKKLLLNSPCITTNIETTEYNPIDDNYIETQINENKKLKEEPIIPLTHIEVESLDDNQCQMLDDAFQEKTHSSDDELLADKVKKKKLGPKDKTEQDYLKILSKDKNLIQPDPEPLPKSPSICKRGQTKKSDVVQKRNSTKSMAKPPTNIAKSKGTNAKSRRTSAKSPRTSTKSMATNTKPPRTNAESRTTSAKSPTATESLTASVESPTFSAESPTTSTKSPTTCFKSLATSAESPTISAKSPTASAESLTASVEFLTYSTKSPSTCSKSLAISAELPTTSIKPTTSTKSPTTSSKSPRASAKSQTTIVKSLRPADTGGGHNGVDDELVEFEIIDLTLEQQVEEIENRKKSDNYLHSPFKCEQCYRGFVDTTTFNNHSRKHDPRAGDIQCGICKFRFSTNRAFHKHTSYHEKKYACKGCSHVSSNISSAKLHQKWHNGVLYKCEICGKLSSRQNSHLTHMRKLHPSQHVCDICGYSFVSEKGVIQHKGIMHKDVVEKDAKDDQDSGQSDSYCEECDVQFVSLEAYKRHLLTSVKHSLDFIGGCKICGARFSSKEDLREHRRQKHLGQQNHFGGYTTRKKYHYPKKKPSRTWPAKCEHCPVMILNARENWTHFRRSHPLLPYPIRRDYVCDICGKGFRGNAFLTYHKRTHSSERLFGCATCGKSFYNRMNLAIHELTHSDAHPYSCKLCSKVFKFRGNLTRHYRIHNGDKPYECDICGKAFTQSNSRNVHIRTVHLKEPPPYTSKARLEKKKLSKKNNI